MGKKSKRAQWWINHWSDVFLAVTVISGIILVFYGVGF